LAVDDLYGLTKNQENCCVVIQIVCLLKHFLVSEAKKSREMPYVTGCEELFPAFFPCITGLALVTFLAYFLSVS
jgi:hypothetical protein